MCLNYFVCFVLQELIDAQYLLNSIIFGSANKLIIDTDRTPLTSLNSVYARVSSLFLNKMCSIKVCIVFILFDNQLFISNKLIVQFDEKSRALNNLRSLI